MKKDIKPFIISLVAFVALAGGVVGLGRFVDFLYPLDSTSDTSSDVTDSSSEEVFDIITDSQYKLYQSGTDTTGSFFGCGEYEYVSFVQDGSWYIDSYSPIQEFEMNYAFNTPTSSFVNQYASYYLAYYQDNHGIGSSLTETSYSKFSLEFNNYALEGGHSYRVGLDIVSSGHDVIFTLSDDLGHFEQDFTFYTGEVSYIEISPGESFRLDHIAATSACYIDAVYIYYF